MRYALADCLELRSKCARAFENDRKSARLLHRALDEKADWLQEYLALGRLGPGMQGALQRRLPERETTSLLEVSASSALLSGPDGRRSTVYLWMITREAGGHWRYPSTSHNEGSAFRLAFEGSLTVSYSLQCDLTTLLPRLECTRAAPYR